MTKAALEAKDEPVAVYGYCPVCGAKGTSRERHPDGNTTCVNGHKYKSRDTLSTPLQQEAKDEPKCNPHPKAPHGFNRNASHSADRYVCECEGWDAYDAGYQAGIEEKNT